MVMKVTYQKKRYNPEMIKSGVVRVGFFEDKKYDDDLPVAQVARWNEYGTNIDHGVPARPFMRPAVFEKKKELTELLRSQYRQAIKDNRNTMLVLHNFGHFVVEAIRAQIDSVHSPENAPITIHGGWLGRKGKKSVYIEGKGGSKPLYDTGFMLNSVDYQAEEVRK